MSVNHSPPYSSWSKPSFFARLALLLAVGSALAMILGGLGTRLDWWHFRTGLTVLKYGAFAAVAAFPLSLLAAIITRPGTHRRGFGISLFALAVSIPAVALPARAYATLRAAPRIHDITTDWQNPPRFTEIRNLRGPDTNPVAYEGEVVAKQQREAYPDIAPVDTNVPPAEAFGAALSTVQDLGWEVVSADENAGRIEAVDTTILFGFKDDIAVRITPTGQGSRVDVRSASRVGISDVGANAKRVRRFLEELKQRLAPQR